MTPVFWVTACMGPWKIDHIVIKIDDLKKSFKMREGRLTPMFRLLFDLRVWNTIL